MRKHFVPILALLMAAAVCAGYFLNGGAGAVLPETPGKLRIATGGESGIYYAYGEALSLLLEKNLGMTVTTIPSGGSMDNIRMMRGGRADIGFVQNDIMTYAYEGTNLFSTEGAFKDFYAMAALYPETCQIVARRDIAGVTDLRGKRVSIGAEGSGTEQNAVQILESYGMDYTDINADHLGFSASVNAFREGRIDAFFCTAGVPTPAIRDLAAEGDAHIVSIGGAHARAILSRYPYYVRQGIPDEAYPGFGAGADTVAVKAALAVSANLSEELVAQIMTVIFDNAAEIEAALPGISLSREAAMEKLPIPMHPGAERFFFGE